MQRNRAWPHSPQGPGGSAGRTLQPCLEHRFRKLPWRHGARVQGKGAVAASCVRQGALRSAELFSHRLKRLCVLCVTPHPACFLSGRPLGRFARLLHDSPAAVDRVSPASLAAPLPPAPRPVHSPTENRGDSPLGNIEPCGAEPKQRCRVCLYLHLVRSSFCKICQTFASPLEYLLVLVWVLILGVEYLAERIKIQENTYSRPEILNS